MRKTIKSVLLAACICCASFSALSVPEDTVGAYQLIASLQGVSIFKETLAVGESAPLELTWSNGALPDLIYTSSDESVATVDQDGIVTGLADGTATITVSRADGKNSRSLDIAVSSEVEKSVIYNTSELSLGDRLRQYDILHYDGKNKGSTANIVNTQGSYDLAFINENDYILPFDAEYVGDWGSCMYLAPDLEGLTYLDGRTLHSGDVIDRNTHLLCYDYEIKSADSSTRLMLPVFLPAYYSKYIGEGEIRVSMIDHDTKTIELESVDVPADPTDSTLLEVQITSEPYDTIIHGEEALDLTGLKLTIAETNGNGTTTSLLEDITLEEAKERYDVAVSIKEEAPGSGTCQITVTQKNETVGDTASFPVSYGAPVVKGDVDSDGELGVSDVILLQKWLLHVQDTSLPDWNRADLSRDGNLDVFDLCLMKRAMIYGGSIE
ncbi:MAG: Ig-like domain-containing protein [Oscillospiraceae bacterium]|nr:Ig-like domain-containing protein [Oscillospiraceae bacterium]